MSRWDRLDLNATLSGAVLDRWCAARVGVVGCGNVGSHFAPEAARSGAHVLACDPEIAEVANLGTQHVREGMPKAVSVADACNAVRPASATAVVADARHLGVGVLERLDLLVDCSDDRGLAPFLTDVSNGLGVPLVRLAVDGTGELELGRCLVSHGGAGHACQICGWTLQDLVPRGERTPCPGAVGERGDGRPPTLAGGAIGAATAAVGLLQAQRLVGGRDAGLVLDRELVLDLSHFGLQAMRLQRAPGCLSGHQAWELVHLDDTARDTTPADLFARARAELGADDVTLELYEHPLHVEATCGCGHHERRLGTAFLPPGRCAFCGGELAWRDELTFGRLGEELARTIGALDTSLLELGLPADGAMVVARARSSAPGTNVAEGAGAAARERRYVLAVAEVLP